MEVVKKQLEVEPKEEMTQEEQKKEPVLARFCIVNNTLEEEKMRQSHHLNIKVSRLKETLCSTPEKDERKLCTILGTKRRTLFPSPKHARRGKI